jgi:hypothetical protein
MGATPPSLPPLRSATCCRLPRREGMAGGYPWRRRRMEVMVDPGVRPGKDAQAAPGSQIVPPDAAVVLCSHTGWGKASHYHPGSDTPVHHPGCGNQGMVPVPTPAWSTQRANGFRRPPALSAPSAVSKCMTLSDALHVQKIGMLRAGLGEVTSPLQIAFSSLKAA